MPHDARAYELYLRGNELARTYDGLARARDLDEELVLVCLSGRGDKDLSEVVGL